MSQYDFGIVGLGVMGRNLLLNMADHGFAVAGLDLDAVKVTSLEKEATRDQQVMGTTSVAEFAGSLKHPRALMLLVPAGGPVDGAIASLLPYLENGDIIVDGGNTYFTDTDRRVTELAAKGIHFFGMGISGGEHGARFGPSMMPGGDRRAYERLRPVFEAVAAKVNGDACVAYMGSGSAGNYVKMVHNGIEYAIMQLIAETYDLLKRGLGLPDDRLQQTFEAWNETELNSFLIEITAKVLNEVDTETGQRLVNVISDWAKAKGTGKWTSQNAMDLQAPVPTIDAAVTMRDLSKLKTERTEAAKRLRWKPVVHESLLEEQFIAQVKNAYYVAMTAIYAQGLAQLRIASEAYQYGLQLDEIIRIWRGGCIIRAACLEDFRAAYQRDRALPNLLLDDEIGRRVVNMQQHIRAVVAEAVNRGIPVPAFMSALAYFDAYRSETLPTNLIQAQRDFFGAHQYERIDREGVFHTQWNG
ncbi:NADP-dependent phosphogluconate dehydrogenase [Parapedobacter lycopersici]|uniref:NADP-dependent phosphogluconate dehydrogenase n=1 Tax=Parapedobacter lycopersici TaxID=1864939 RepID=UPI003340CEE7